MKATGRSWRSTTFGSALNKALRALEQAGAGWLAENAGWQATLDYLMEPAVAEPAFVTVDTSGLVCEARAHAERMAYPIVLKRFLAPSDSRLWRILALLRRACRRSGSAASRHLRLVPVGVRRAIALEREVRRYGARIASHGR